MKGFFQDAGIVVVLTVLFVDDINALSPDAQIGLVIFTWRLAFDHRENPFFKTAFPGDTTQHDSFVPLTALNKIFPGYVRARYSQGLAQA